MKTNLDYLPEYKKEELNRIKNVILKDCPDVEMIILFGSYARGDFKEEKDLNPKGKSGHSSDYDILVVTSKISTAIKIGLWDRIAIKCNALNLTASYVRIIAHDIKDINLKLSNGQYFYTDIKKEGRLLHNAGNFEFAEPKELSPDERRKIAQDHFDFWFNKAQGFLKNYIFNFNEKDYPLAAFMLHQATETFYKTIFLVFENYCPNKHMLRKLGKMAHKHNANLHNIFPRDTEEQKKRFELLDLAYIGARYNPAYKITADDLEYLSKRVTMLLDMTEKMCKEKIESF